MDKEKFEAIKKRYPTSGHLIADLRRKARSAFVGDPLDGQGLAVALEAAALALKNCAEMLEQFEAVAAMIEAREASRMESEFERLAVLACREQVPS